MMRDRILRGFGMAHHFYTEVEVEDDGDGVQREDDEIVGGLFSSGLWFLSELASTFKE